MAFCSWNINPLLELEKDRETLRQDLKTEAGVRKNLEGDSRTLLELGTGGGSEDRAMPFFLSVIM